MANEITEAIIAEASHKISEPYSTTRKIQGFVRNKFRGAKRDAFGGSADAKSRGKVVGRNLAKVSPKALAAGAKNIPVIGSYVATIIKTVGQMAADKAVQKLDAMRVTELKSKQVTGRMSVKEMTEMIQKEGSMKISADVVGKMHDAVRKVDQSYGTARTAIMSANDCNSVYKAAKNYEYLKYRVVRLQVYIEGIREHLDRISEMNERYGAEIIGFEDDLIGMMDDFFANAGPDYHTANCKDQKHCYYQAHGLA